MYRIILPLFLIFNVSAKQCFSVGSDTYEFKKIKNHQYLVSRSDKKYSTYYFCSKEKSSLECTGDDDSGEFTIKNSKLIMKSSFNFGSPDGPNYELKKQKKPLALKKCK